MADVWADGYNFVWWFCQTAEDKKKAQQEVNIFELEYEFQFIKLEN